MAPTYGTRPAQYASSILLPLSTFILNDLTSSGGGGGGINGSSVGENAKKRTLVHAVLEGVCERYRDLADDTLSTVRKTESSLRRLKSRKEGVAAGATAAAATTDVLGTDALIAMQLALDIEEFGKKVKECCGVDPEQDLKMFEQLKNVVAVVAVVEKPGTGTGGAPNESS